MSEEKILTKEIAEQFLEDEDIVDELPDFAAYEKIEEEALLAILDFEIPEEQHEANREGHDQLSLIDRWIDADPMGATLYLDGLLEVSPSLAEILTRFRMNLSLNGLTEVSDDSLEILTKNEGSLFLNGLSEIGDRNAEILRMVLGNSLELNGITELSESVAENLSRFHGDLHLDGVKLLNESASLFLSKHFGSRLDQSTEWEEHLGAEGYPIVTQSKLLVVGTLSLNGVTSISDETAENLSMYSGFLSLNGLTSLSDSAVESLSKHEGDYLNLNGLTKLSDSAVESLSKIKGGLILDGLTELSDPAAKYLSKIQPEIHISFEGLTKISDEVAESLAKIDRDEIILPAEIEQIVERYRADDEGDDWEDE